MSSYIICRQCSTKIRNNPNKFVRNYYCPTCGSLLIDNQHHLADDTDTDFVKKYCYNIEQHIINKKYYNALLLIADLFEETHIERFRNIGAECGYLYFMQHASLPNAYVFLKEISRSQYHIIHTKEYYNRELKLFNDMLGIDRIPYNNSIASLIQEHQPQDFHYSIYIKEFCRTAIIAIRKNNNKLFNITYRIKAIHRLYKFLEGKKNIYTIL